jgi:putative tricarboxylic transport membrane protein
MTSGGAEPSGTVPSRSVAIGEAIIGAGVLALAAVMLWQTLAIPVSPIYAQVGPTVVPIITALALGMLGVLLLIAAWQGGWQPEEEKASTPDRVALAWVAAGLVLNVLLIGWAGFTIASVILFVCVARGFGSKAIVRDAAIGAAFALIAYFGFAQTLGINIGSGLVENAIERVIGTEGEGG